MKYRTFGRTGIKVSEIIFGGGNVGGIIIHKDDATKREAIRRALTGGINWIDTAAQYGNGKSEEALGWLIPESGATPYLSTKLVTGRFFMERMLPETHVHLARIQTGCATTMELAAEAF